MSYMQKHKGVYMFAAMPENQSELHRKRASRKAVNKTTDFHGAAIVDSNGQEIPITETMVQQALNTLAKGHLSQRYSS